MPLLLGYDEDLIARFVSHRVAAIKIGEPQGMSSQDALILDTLDSTRKLGPQSETGGERRENGASPISRARGGIVAPAEGARPGVQERDTRLR